MVSKAAYMKFIYYQVIHRKDWLFAIAPVKIILDNAGMIRSAVVGGGTPNALLCDSSGVRIKEHFVFIKDLAVLRVRRAVKPVGIFKILDIKAKYDH